MLWKKSSILIKKKCLFELTFVALQRLVLEVRLPSWGSILLQTNNTRTAYLYCTQLKWHKRNLHKGRTCYCVFSSSAIIIFLSHPPEIFPFMEGDQQTGPREPSCPSWWSGRAFLRPAGSCSGLRCAAAGAGRALCAADTVGRAAVLWGGLRLLDRLCARSLT